MRRGSAVEIIGEVEGRCSVVDIISGLKSGGLSGLNPRKVKVLNSDSRYYK